MRYIIILFLLFPSLIWTQNYQLFSVPVGVGGFPSSSSILDLQSTTRGFLLPRMTTTQRDAISSPATGLSIYNTTTNTIDVYDGTNWQKFGQQTLIRGGGTTSATASLTVQNSNATAQLQILDNGRINQTIPSSSNTTVFGTNAGAAVTGASNSFFGFSAGQSTTSGNSNVYAGTNAALSSNGSNNVFIGVSAGQESTSGGSNTFIGLSSGRNNSTGSSNTYVGLQSGLNNTGGTNVFIGVGAGSLISNGNSATTVNSSVLIGAGTRVGANSQTNQIVIGNDAIGNGSNTSTIGSSSIVAHYLSGVGAARIPTSTTLNRPTNVQGFLRYNTTTLQSEVNNGTAWRRIIDLPDLTPTDGSIPVYTTAWTTSTLADAGILTGSGVVGQVAFWSSDSTFTGDNSFFWDNANKRLGIGTASPSVASIVEMNSTTSGVLIPRMTTTQRDLISSPTDGLMIYNTTTKAINTYNGATSAWVSVSGGGGEASDSLLFGNKYNTVGFLFQDNFSGTTLNNNHYEVVGSSIYVGTSQLNYGVSVNNKLVVPDSTIAGWQRFIQMSRNFGQIEKGELVIKFSPTTKNVGNGIAIWQHSPVLFFAQQSAIRIDLSNGINSGRVGYGNDTTNVLYWSQALNFSIGDTLELRLVRNPFQTEVYFKNLTQNTPTAYGVFPVLSWGTQGKLRLVSFGGGQEIYNWSLLSNQRKYDGNSGVVFIGNSITSGFTVSNKSERWTDIVMRGQQHLYENLAIQSYTSVEIENENLLAIADSINAKHMVLSIGYNDVSQSVNLDSFENRVNRIVTRAQAIGYNVIITSIFPRIAGLPTSYNIRLQNVATARNCKYIDITTATSANNAVNINMLDGDNIHPNEQGHLAIANAIIAAAPELTTIITDSLNSSLSIFNLPAGSASDNIITINPVTKQLREYPNLFNPEFWLRLETGQAQQVGNIGVTGNILAGGFLQIRNNNQPGRIGFNDGLGTSIGAPNNLIITNSGVNGTGSPQSFDQVSGSGNIKIFAGRDYAAKANSTGTISGSLNTFLNSTFGTNIVSGNNNSLISAYFLENLSGSNNLGWGQRAIAGVNSGSNNIHLISLGNVNGNSFTFPATLSNSIVIGGLYDFVPTEVVQNGEVIINAPIRSDRYYTFGPKGGIITSTFMRPGLGVQGTNTPGEPWIFQGARGTGGAQSGIIAYEFSTKNASGSNVQSSYTRTMQIRERGVVIGRNATLIQSEDALLDLQSISSALVLPRLTTTQINNNYVGGVLSIALTSGGSGYTNGNVELSFTGGGGSGARGYATISSGVVQSVTLTERGTGYTSNPSVSVTSGIGNGASITASIGASNGGLVFNSTTGQVNMYSSGLRVLNAGITGSATLDFADTASGNYADLTITVTGAADGDVVSLGIPNASMPAGACSFTAWVSAADTVTVRFSNFSGGNLNPASGTFRAFVTK